LPTTNKKRLSLDLGLYSQYLDVRDLKWKWRACGIIALRTILALYGVDDDIPASIDEWMKFDLVNGAYKEGDGWLHQGLANIASRHNLDAEVCDWSRLHNKAALGDFLRVLSMGPCIVSIHRDFNPNNGGHLIVATHADHRSIHYRDPAARTRHDIIRRITFEEFIHGWTRRIIVFRT